MHPLILFDANEPGEFAARKSWVGRSSNSALKLAAAQWGTWHRARKNQSNVRPVQHDEITTFHAVKAAFDPDGLLTLGKTFPRYTAVLNLVPCMCSRSFTFP